MTDDLLNSIPLPDDLPGNTAADDRVERWLRSIVPAIVEMLTKQGEALHAGKTITFRHPFRGRGASGSVEMWKLHVLRVVELLTQRGYEASAVFEEKPDEPVLKIKIKK